MNKWESGSLLWAQGPGEAWQENRAVRLPGRLLAYWQRSRRHVLPEEPSLLVKEASIGSTCPTAGKPRDLPSPTAVLPRPSVEAEALLVGGPSKRQ